MSKFKSTFNDEQKALYNHVKMLDSLLMPLSRHEFLRLTFQFAEHLNIKHQFTKKKGTAGKEFYCSFMKKQADLTLRSAESTSLQRATGFNKEQVDRFFEKLKERMDKYAFKPTRIFNADETGVSVVHVNQLKIISMKGKKQVGNLISAERGKNVTVLL